MDDLELKHEMSFDVTLLHFEVFLLDAMWFCQKQVWVCQPPRIRLELCTLRKRRSNSWIRVHSHRNLLGHFRDLQAAQWLVVSVAMKDLIVAIPWRFYYNSTCSTTTLDSFILGATASIAKRQGYPAHLSGVTTQSHKLWLDCTGVPPCDNVKKPCEPK